MGVRKDHLTLRQPFVSYFNLLTLKVEVNVNNDVSLNFSLFGSPSYILEYALYSGLIGPNHL